LGAYGERKYFGSPPKTIDNHISCESTLVASLVNIGGRLRSIERSTRLVWQTHSLTHSLTGWHTTWLYNLSNAADALGR